MEAERQTRALGGVFRVHGRASHLFVPCALEGSYDIFPSPADRRDHLAQLRTKKHTYSRRKRKTRHEGGKPEISV